MVRYSPSRIVMELPTLHWSSSQPVCSDGSGLEVVSCPCPAKECPFFFTRVNLAAAKSGRTHRLNLSALHHNRRANILKQFETCCCQEKFDETGPEFTFLGHPSDPSGPHPASLVTPKHFPTASASHGSLAWRHRKDWRTGRTWRKAASSIVSSRRKLGAGGGAEPGRFSRPWRCIVLFDR